METFRRIAVVGSRKFENYAQLERVLDGYFRYDDEIVSGGAIGVDTFAQRYAKEHGFDISIKYPKYQRFGRGATFERNKRIAQASSLVLAFYAKGHFQEGGTANTVEWARKLGIPFEEFEEE